MSEKIQISEETITKFNDLLKEKNIFNASLNLHEHLEPKTTEAFDPVCSSESMKKAMKYMVEDASPYTLIVNKSETGEINGFIYIKPVNSCVSTGDFAGEPTCSIEFICTSIKGISKYLIGIIMYAIYNDNTHIKNVILQTDRGYTNSSAYCLYKKMGFNYDEKLFSSCFNNLLNVPMYCNPYDNEKLIQNLSSSDNYDELCLEKDAAIQQNLAVHKKIQIYLAQNLKKNKLNFALIKKNIYGNSDKSLKTEYETYLVSLITKYPKLVLESYKDDPAKRYTNLDMLLINKELTPTMSGGRITRKRKNPKKTRNNKTKYLVK
uniref:Uncharacterized protein n=1 Tax=viral metagenome TaxID=1070528 RepID=A0A6C0BT77_9ZZZZ